MVFLFMHLSLSPTFFLCFCRIRLFTCTFPYLALGAKGAEASLLDFRNETTNFADVRYQKQDICLNNSKIQDFDVSLFVWVAILCSSAKIVYRAWDVRMTSMKLITN